MTCYPESVREIVAKFRKISHDHHWCTECIETKEKPNKPKGANSEDLLSKWMREKKKKRCKKCGKKKTLDAYPEKIYTQLVKRKALCHDKHACSKCVGEQAKP